MKAWQICLPLSLSPGFLPRLFSELSAGPSANLGPFSLPVAVSPDLLDLGLLPFLVPSPSVWMVPFSLFPSVWMVPLSPLPLCEKLFIFVWNPKVKSVANPETRKLFWLQCCFHSEWGYFGVCDPVFTIHPTCERCPCLSPCVWMAPQYLSAFGSLWLILRVLDLDLRPQWTHVLSVSPSVWMVSLNFAIVVISVYFSYCRLHCLSVLEELFI